MITFFLPLMIDEWQKKNTVIKLFYASFFMPANFFKKTSLSRNILLKIPR